MTRMAGSIKGIGSFLGTRPDYSDLGSQSVVEAARDFSSVTEGNAYLTNVGLKAEADMASSQHYADASAASAQAASQASIVGGFAGGIGGLAGFMPKGGLFNKGKTPTPGETLLERSQKPYTIV
tara:strand:+ start:6739 stop:7110 length:372 start_codon:yes stop_codon:yes gene_type:complete